MNALAVAIRLKAKAEKTFHDRGEGLLQVYPSRCLGQPAQHPMKIYMESFWQVSDIDLTEPVLVFISTDITLKTCILVIIGVLLGIDVKDYFER